VVNPDGSPGNVPNPDKASTDALAMLPKALTNPTTLVVRADCWHVQQHFLFVMHIE
jgi:hypothetical protein